MKKRIREEIDSNGISKFYIEVKFIFWWVEKYPVFMSREKAEAFINYKPDFVVKWH